MFSELINVKRVEHKCLKCFEDLEGCFNFYCRHFPIVIQIVM